MTKTLLLAAHRRSVRRSMAAVTLLFLVTALASGARAEAQGSETHSHSVDAPAEGRQLEILQQGAEGLAGAAQGRIGHRLKLIFPLILAIAARLATLVPIGLSVLGAVTLMVMFAKKAFIISLLTLGVTLWDKWASRRQPASPPTYYHPPAPPSHSYHSPPPTFYHPPAPPPTLTSWSHGPHDAHTRWHSSVSDEDASHWVEGEHAVAHSPAHALFQGQTVSPGAVHHSYGHGGDHFRAMGSAPVSAQRKPQAAILPFPSHGMAHRDSVAGWQPSGAASDGIRRQGRWPPPRQRR